MDQAPAPDHHKPHHEPHHEPQPMHAPVQPQPYAAPVAAPPIAASGTNWLHRTSSAFTAEYCMFIIALGIALASLTWLVYLFFIMVAAAMTGSAGGGSILKLIVLWLVIASLVSLPAAVILWSRTKGELLANEHFKGVLPGGARGFRTFWIVLTVLGMIGMLISSLYAPLAILVGSGVGLGEVLVGFTIPGLLGLGIAAGGIYLMTRPAANPGMARMLLWVVGGLTALLFIVNFVWAANTPDRYSPYRSTSPSYDSYYDSYSY